MATHVIIQIYNQTDTFHQEFIIYVYAQRGCPTLVYPVQTHCVKLWLNYHWKQKVLITLKPYKGHLIFVKCVLIMYCKCLLQGPLQLIDVYRCWSVMKWDLPCLKWAYRHGLQSNPTVRKTARQLLL